MIRKSRNEKNYAQTADNRTDEALTGKTLPRKEPSIDEERDRTLGGSAEKMTSTRQINVNSSTLVNKSMMGAEAKVSHNTSDRRNSLSITMRSK